MAIQAGRLRHRVTIQTPVEARNGFNEVITTWSTVATVWASVDPLMGRELFDAEHVQSEITHRVRMRYRSGMTAEMRLLFGTRDLRVQSVLTPREVRHEMVLMCREMAA